MDRGGTFTDVIGIDPDGAVHSTKLLSESDAREDAGITGIRRLMGIGNDRPLSADAIAKIRIGTTVATNALLERKGERAAFAVTEGFEDLLEIGNGQRPDLFALDIRKHPPLHDAVRGIPEAIAADGTVRRRMDIEAARSALKELQALGIRSLAIVLKHAWKNPVHERRLAALAREEAGFLHVVSSHEAMPLINMLKRGQSTMIEAYLSPVLFSYLLGLRRLAGDVPIEFMQSSGGLRDAGGLRAMDTILSGPAGGLMGYAETARRLAISESIGFDMGGTSTDVSRFDGTFEHRYETTVDNVPFHTEMLDVQTVAAGGGSILWFDGERLRVGPESAGSNPGPACYGLGGPLTVTDANLMLGRIIPESMPSTFGPSTDAPVDRNATHRLFTALALEVTQATGTPYDAWRLAAGFIEVANGIMCRAMKSISVSRGYDIRCHSLLAFGGAAAQHACRIASILAIPQVVVPRHASVLSAWGIAMAEKTERRVEPVMQPLTERLLDDLGRRAETGILSLLDLLGAGNRTWQSSVLLDIRPAGSDSWISVPASLPDSQQALITHAALLERFSARHHRRYGFTPDTGSLEVVGMRLEVSLSETHDLMECSSHTSMAERQQEPSAEGSTQLWIAGSMVDVPLYRREKLHPGAVVSGPAMIVDSQLTLFVEAGYLARPVASGSILMRAENEAQEAAEETLAVLPDKADPVLLEVFHNLFMNIAEQMGKTLENTAHSVNMKERRDFSCALFDREGRLVSNAPHIPVHLGAMEATVRSLIDEGNGRFRPGDVLLANNPHRGGSHLPDMTVVTPVFSGDDEPTFYLANRGHHADIGGITPGSMPPSSRTIDEEGVVITSFLLVKEGRFRRKELQELLSSGPWPARNMAERLSDLQAQVAANKRGMLELEAVLERYGVPLVDRYMEFIRINARNAVERLFRRLAGEGGRFEATCSDRLDNGAAICASALITAPSDAPARAIFDFSGSAPEDQGNLNAPPAVTRAAVLYLLRLLVGEEIPLNAGCLEPVEILIPEGSILNPSPTAAVAMGNVETSQRVVDVLLGAFGCAAASQGTMNNLLFGPPDGSGSQYYETIPGGSGATRTADGASAVQVHMTNTRITDPEILEERHQGIEVEQFSIRRESGGNGMHRGGDGVVRRIRFHTPMQLSVISERRKRPPFGLEGGQPGAKGVNRIVLEDGTETPAGGRIGRLMRPGEAVVIETPGGGGFGTPPMDREGPP
ncbi:5-oxoprolinase [Chlorobium sp. N1]|nr:5-oxoprolinase [Chlorobium sp. N1]